MHETNGTPLLRRVTSMAPALLLLSFLVVHWTATQASGRLVQLGGWLWPGYAAELPARRRPCVTLARFTRDAG